MGGWGVILIKPTVTLAPPQSVYKRTHCVHFTGIIKMLMLTPSRWSNGPCHEAMIDANTMLRCTPPPLHDV